MVLFGNKTSEVSGLTVTNFDKMKAAAATLQDIIGDSAFLQASQNAYIVYLRFLGDGFTKVGLLILDVTRRWLSFLISAYDEIIAVTGGAIGAMRAAWDNWPDIIKDIGIRGINFFIGVTESGVNKVIEIFNFLPKALTGLEIIPPAVFDRVVNDAKGAVDLIGDGFVQGYLDSTGTVSGIMAGFSVAYAARLEELGESNQRLTESLDKQADSMTDIVAQAKIYGAQLGTLGTTAGTTADSIDEVAAATERLNAQQRTAATVLSQSESSIDQATAALISPKTAQDDWLDGLEKGEPLTAAAARAQQILATNVKLATFEVEAATSGFSDHVAALKISNDQTDNALGLWLEAGRRLDAYEDSIGGVNGANEAQQAILRGLETELDRTRTALEKVKDETDKTTSAFEGAKAGAQSFIDSLGTMASRTAGLVQDSLNTARDALQNFFRTGDFDAGTFFDGLKDKAAQFFANDLIDFVTTGESAVLNFFQGMTTASNTSNAEVTAGSTSLWEGITARTGEGQTFIQTAFTAIGSAGTTLWEGLSSAAGFAWDFITGGSRETEQAIGGDFGTMAEAGTSLFTGLTSDAGGFWSGFQTLAQGGLTFLSKVWNGMKSGGLSFIGDIGSAFNSFFSSVIGGLQRFGGAIPGIIGGAIGLLGGSIGRAVDTGISLVKGAIKFIGGLFAEGGIVEGFAGGGKIRGPGTGTSDSIAAFAGGGTPIAVSNGEFIVNAASTKKFGGLIQAINDNNVPGFADGGFHGAGGGPGNPRQSLEGVDPVENRKEREREERVQIARDAAVFVTRQFEKGQGVLGLVGGLVADALEGELTKAGIAESVVRGVISRAGFGPTGALLLTILDNKPDIVGAALDAGLTVTDEHRSRGSVIGAGLGAGIGGGVNGDTFDVQFGNTGDSFTPIRVTGEGNRARQGIIDIAAAGRDRLGTSLTGSLGSLATTTNNLLTREANLPFITAPGREHGGSVTRGRPFMVGEAGPEIFVPGQSGQVLPIGGGNDEVVRVLQKIVQQNNQIIQQNDELLEPTKRTARNTDRQRLGGALAGRKAS